MTDGGNQEIASQLAGLEDVELLNTITAAIADRAEVIQCLSDWMFAEDEKKAYVSTKMFTTSRLDGVVKSFNQEKGYGFIACDGCQEAFGCDVFVHGAQLNGVPVGKNVSFVIFLNKDQKPQAFDVRQGDSTMSGKQIFQSSSSGKAPAKGGGKGSYAAAGAAGWGAAAWGGAGACWSGKGAYWGGAKGAMAGAWNQNGGAFWGGGKPGAAGSGKAAAGTKGASGKDAKGAGKARKAGGGTEDAPPSSAEVDGVTNVRWQGVLKSFNDGTGFGFIECEDLKQLYGNDVFVHRLQVAELTPVPGMSLSFGVFLNKDGKPQAKDLTVEGGNAAKRPRQW